MDASYWDSSSSLWAKYDLDFYRKRFIEHSARIFSTDKDEIEILRPCSVPLVSEAHEIKTNYHQKSSEICMYIARQSYSWAQVNVKQETFEKILSLHNVFPPFLDVLHSFGLKAGADEKVWDGFYAAVPYSFSNDIAKSRRLDLCYNLRYVEKHGRQSSCRWSLRQFGVYHSFHRSNGPETLVFLQPPESIYKYLCQHRRASHSSDHGSASPHPMLIHVIMLFRTLNNWDEYIEDLRGDLMQLDDKACFSKMGFIDKPNDYPVTFGDKQKLQLLRHKFLRALSVFDSYLEVANGLVVQLSKLDEGMALQGEMVKEEVNTYCSQIRRHRRNLSVLLKTFAGTEDLLSKILEHRNDRVQYRTSDAMRGSLDTLNQIASQSSVAVEQSREDSKMLKTLTLTTTMYIPATLLATLFSSNLVQLRPDSEGNENNTHFKLVKQFWLYLILTVLLTAVTLIPTLVSRKTTKRWFSIA